MPAPPDRAARLAQKLRANLARRKQQARAREDGARADEPREDEGREAEPAAALDRDDPPA